MTRSFRFVVLGSLADFRALGWTRACLNIRLTQPESVFELSKDDVFVDIVLPYDFNAPIKGVSWPLRLTHLTFGSCFKQPVDTLPASVTHLAFGALPVLPVSLTHLTFGWGFNQSGNHLPVSLSRLKFGY
jgi:hypothetical protein